MKFINRDAEIKYLNAHFESEPNSLLFLYGPKSSGKSTLLEKVINELDLKKYIVNYINLRGVLIYNFKSFLDVFFQRNIKNKAIDILEGITINLGFFNLNIDEEAILKENAF
ncbi:MAG: ATP-binding protein, partial [Bacteroidia bacterium]|nr:ATP-binding protein [Bacteroidia bacterium]